MSPTQGWKGRGLALACRENLGPMLLEGSVTQHAGRSLTRAMTLKTLPRVPHTPRQVAGLLGLDSTWHLGPAEAGHPTLALGSE